MIAPFVLAIVGRPNVGKSTLFNRLVGRKLALVDDQPGVTRDRRFGDARLGDLRFQIVDTAGFEEGKTGSLEARMRAQTEAAIGEADMVLMLTDARVGLLPEDELFARILRKANVPVILASRLRCRPSMATARMTYTPKCATRLRCMKKPIKPTSWS